MTNPYRAMCAELVAAWDALPWEYDWLGNAIGAHGDLCDDSAVVRARDLLAQPVAEGPTDDKLMDIARATDLVYYMGEDCGFASLYMEGTDITAEVLAYARAVLAKWGNSQGILDSSRQPVPEMPTDEELTLTYAYSVAAAVGNKRGQFTTEDIEAAQLAGLRAVLAKWGTLTPQPVAVSERLPGPEDCNEQGRCWMFGNVEGDWRLISTINPGIPKLKYCFSHWLPANALPTPEA